MSRKTVSYDPSCDIVTITAVATCYVFSCIGFNFFYLNVCYSAPDRRAEYCDERVCLSVCLCVCLSVREHIFETARPIFTRFFVHVTLLPMVVARSSSGGIVICYVLLVLWMTPYLLISQCCSTSPPS